MSEFRRRVLELDERRLAAARGVVADIAHHADIDVVAACETIVALGDDVDEVIEASDLICRILLGEDRR